MKIYGFRLKFHWSFPSIVQLAINQHWFREGLGANQARRQFLTNDGLAHWRIYVSLGLRKLIQNLVCSFHKEPGFNISNYSEFVVFHYSFAINRKTKLKYDRSERVKNITKHLCSLVQNETMMTLANNVDITMRIKGYDLCWE